jgi:hypothetical protein
MNLENERFMRKIEHNMENIEPTDKEKHNTDIERQIRNKENAIQTQYQNIREDPKSEQFYLNRIAKFKKQIVELNGMWIA